MTEKIKRILQVYKKHLEDYGNDVAYVNETNIHSEKAVVVTLFCINFTKEDENGLHDNCLIQFWCPRKLCWYNCSNGANRKIPKWLAIKNIEKCLELGTTNLVK